MDFSKANLQDVINSDKSADLIGGKSEGQAIGSDLHIQTVPTTDFGPGPQGNMFGSSVHAAANNVIDAAMAFGGPDAVVETRTLEGLSDASEGREKLVEGKVIAGVQSIIS
jgi:hypothetical protein